VPEAFDPYHKWLGIPPKDQPPNHYRLLGLELFESDVDAIASAADQRMGHVRTFQSGKHAELSQRILNEIAAARICLLSPQKKAAYDDELRGKLAASSPPEPLPTNGMQTPTAEPVGPAAQPLPEVSPSAAHSSPRHPAYRTLRRRQSWQLGAAIVGAGAVVLGVVLVVVFSSGRNDEGEPEGQRPTAHRPSEPLDPLRPKEPKGPTERPKPEPPEKPEPKPPEAKVPPDSKLEKPEPEPKPPKPAEPTPLPVPPAAEQEAALERLRPAYEGLSAAQLREAAMTAGRDPVDRFVLLAMARDAEVAAGNLKEAMETVDLLAKHFQTDAPAMKTEALLALAQTVESPEAFHLVSEGCLALGQEALEAGDVERGAKLAECALSAARRSDDVSLIAQATLLIKRAEEAGRQDGPATPSPESE
jgi:hypothetical protein